MSGLKGLVDNWIPLAQGLIGSIGALALAMVHLSCIWPTQHGAGFPTVSMSRSSLLDASYKPGSTCAL